MRVDEISLLRGQCKDLVAAKRSESSASRFETHECLVRSQSRSHSQSARSEPRLWPPVLTEPSVHPTEFTARSGRPSAGGRLTTNLSRTNSKPSISARLRRAQADWTRMSETSVVQEAWARPQKQAPTGHH
jgi:hypothetical protein